MEIRREKLKHVLCFAFNKQQHGKSAFDDTVRPRDTRPQTARTLTMHVFELGPKKFEIHVGRWSEKRVVYYIKSAN